MRVYIVYTQFCDDPSSIKGIFTERREAEACYNNWDDNYKELIEIEVNKVFEKEIVLQ